MLPARQAFARWEQQPGTDMQIVLLPMLVPYAPVAREGASLLGQKMDKSRIAFAKAVITRTAAKVHGTTVGGRVLPVEEHTRALIVQATSSQRLSRMYEGWMPWL